MTAKLPPPQDLKDLIQVEHCRSELERLSAGYDGCGCLACQEFYKTLDLEEYGERVITDGGGLVVIVAGRKGGTLWKQYHQDEKFRPFPKKEVPENPPETIKENLVADAPPKRGKTHQDAKIVVTKIPGGELSLGENITVIMQHEKKRLRGRPIKEGKVTRMTEWRRRQKELQGVLL